MSNVDRRNERARLVTKARHLLDTARAEARDLTSYECEQYERIDGEIDRLSDAIATNHRPDADRFAKQDALERLLHGSGHPGETAYRIDPRDNPRASQAYKSAFSHFLSAGWAGLPHPEAELLSTWQVDKDTSGGYVVAPEQWVLELLKNIDDTHQIRRLARKLQVRGAVSLSAPVRTTKASTSVWGSELATPTEDAAMRFGKRKLTPHHTTGEIVIGRDMLRGGVLDVDAIVRGEIARDAGDLEETAFMTGHGAQQPLGLFTPSDDGIPTSRDVAGDNTTTAITADTLIDVRYSLKSEYAENAVWLFHRTVLKSVRKLKDAVNGQYLWQPGLQAGEPDTILGSPVVPSESAPSTMTAGLYVGLYGDLSYYWIVDDVEMEVQVLRELLARQNSVSYLSRRKVDAAPVRTEAFIRIQLAAE